MGESSAPLHAGYTPSALGLDILESISFEQSSAAIEDGKAPAFDTVGRQRDKVKPQARVRGLAAPSSIVPAEPETEPSRYPGTPPLSPGSVRVAA